MVLVYMMTLFVFEGSALADTPLFTPDQFMVCSSNTKYCVVVHRICPDTRKGCAYLDVVTRVNAYKVIGNESFAIWGIMKKFGRDPCRVTGIISRMTRITSWKRGGLIIFTT